MEVIVLAQSPLGLCQQVVSPQELQSKIRGHDLLSAGTWSTQLPFSRGKSQLFFVLLHCL